jgi:hypothetical protein
MAAVSDPASVVDQLGQQGQELLERSQTMIADMLRGYLGQFQVGTSVHGACACADCCSAAVNAVGTACDVISGIKLLE